MIKPCVHQRTTQNGTPTEGTFGRPAPSTRLLNELEIVKRVQPRDARVCRQNRVHAGEADAVLGAG